MSSKNTLQEYCQRNKLPLPAYVTKRINDEHETIPIFESVLIFDDKTYVGQGTSKVSAEKAVAQLVCQNLTSSSIAEKLPIIQKYNTIMDLPSPTFQNIYLIDGDNCQVSDEKIFADNNNFVIYFIAKNNTKPLPLEHQKKYDNCCVFVSDTITRDATDHLLTLYLGKLSVILPQKNFYVVTKDHFGECLEKFVKNCKFLCNI